MQIIQKTLFIKKKYVDKFNIIALYDGFLEPILVENLLAVLKYEQIEMIISMESANLTLNL